MTKKSHRIAFTLLAVGLAVILVLLLTYAGGRAKGPFESLFSWMGSLVHSAESSLILDRRNGNRTERLSWLNRDRNLRESLLRPKVILLGAFDNESAESFESIVNFEASLGVIFPLIHLYSAWGSKHDQKFPELSANAVSAMGSVPVITWEPWLTDFTDEDIPGLKPGELRDLHGMKDVAAELYDQYILGWAMTARKYGKPIFLRMGHEMNDPYRYPWGPQNNTAEEFKAAWRHVWNVFRAAGTDNVIWIWSPHPAYGYFKEYYPGDGYVDFIGVGALNYGNVAAWSKWWTFDEIFGKHYPALAAFGKPIMITEFGSLNTGGDRKEWYEQAAASLPAKYPQVKALIFFHYSKDLTTTQQPLNWYIKNDTAVIRALGRQIRNWPDSVKK